MAIGTFTLRLGALLLAAPCLLTSALPVPQIPRVVTTAWGQVPGVPAVGTTNPTAQTQQQGVTDPNALFNNGFQQPQQSTIPGLFDPNSQQQFGTTQTQPGINPINPQTVQTVPGGIEAMRQNPFGQVANAPQAVQSQGLNGAQQAVGGGVLPQQQQQQQTQFGQFPQSTFPQQPTINNGVNNFGQPVVNNPAVGTAQQTTQPTFGAGSISSWGDNTNSLNNGVNTGCTWVNGVCVNNNNQFNNGFNNGPVNTPQFPSGIFGR